MFKSINWKVRFKNVDFWMSFVPAVILLVQGIAAAFGYDWDFVAVNQHATAILNALLGILSLLGVVNDPTTQTMCDSAQAMTYEEPKPLIPDFN